MQDDEYELMPRNELEYLRHEVEKLKRNPLGDTQASISLLDSLNKLNTSVTKLNEILAGANDEMVKAFNEAQMQEQMRKVLEQQEKLARGIVAVAELVKDVQKKQQAMPDLDQFLAQVKPSSPQPGIVGGPATPGMAPLPPPLPADAVTAKNPFVDAPGGQEFAPLLNQPLPHPGLSPQQNAPGYMLHPGVQDGRPSLPTQNPGPRIDDIEIPLPPRRY